jgi:hypothetical protein
MAATTAMTQRPARVPARARIGRTVRVVAPIRDLDETQSQILVVDAGVRAARWRGAGR